MLASPSGAHAGMRVCQSNLTSHSRRRAQPQPHADFQPLPLLDSESEAIRHDLMSGAAALPTLRGLTHVVPLQLGSRVQASAEEH